MAKIDDFMTVSEAAYRWNIPLETVKNRLKPSVNKDLNKMIDEGLVKYFQKPNSRMKSWIISKQAMEIWFGEQNNT